VRKDEGGGGRKRRKKGQRYKPELKFDAGDQETWGFPTEIVCMMRSGGLYPKM